MCVIAYVPKNRQIKEETVRQMFEANPHGAGIMWKPAENQDVKIQKGFMDVEDLVKSYYKIPAECEKAIHCRIATSGKISVECCHPFPVRKETLYMKSENDSEKMAMMHNGILGFCTPEKQMNSKYSDSMKFASDYLYPLRKRLDLKVIRNLIEAATEGSKILVFRRGKDTVMFGEWEEEDGIFYSNTTFKYTAKFCGCGDAYIDWYDDCLDETYMEIKVSVRNFMGQFKNGNGCLDGFEEMLEEYLCYDAGITSAWLKSCNLAEKTAIFYVPAYENWLKAGDHFGYDDYVIYVKKHVAKQKDENYNTIKNIGEKAVL